MLFVRSLKLPLALLLSISALSAQAVTVQSQLQALGGNSYQYNYTITNDDLVSGFDEISIFFSNTQYQNLAVTASPFDWDSIVLQPDEFLDGVFDSLALSSPLALGDSVSGFSVSFDWLGAELPGAQNFDVLDSSSLTVLQSGTSSVTAVPLPASLPLMSAALAGLAFIRQRRK
jgi:hypothetical protein